MMHYRPRSRNMLKEARKLQGTRPRRSMSASSNINPEPESEYFKNAFHLILKTVSLFGVTCTPYSPSNNFLLKSYWDTAFLILSTVTYSISLLDAHTFIPSRHIRFTFYAYFILGYIIRITLLLKRQIIPSAMAHLASLRHYPDAGSSRKCFRSLRWQIVAFYGWIMTTTIVIISYVYKISSNNLELQAFGYGLSRKDIGSAVLIVPICLAFASINTSIIICISLMICCNLYLGAEDVLKIYGDCLVRLSNQRITRNSLMSQLSFYKSIIFCFTETDSAISMCVLHLYATAVVCFFNTVSVVISFYGDRFYYWDISVMGQFLYTFLMALVIFCSVTRTGSGANSSHGNLKVKLMESIENVLGNSTCHIETMMSFRMLSDVIGSVSPNFTAGGMFTVDKSLILTTIGAMVTYGVLLFQ